MGYTERCTASLLTDYPDYPDFEARTQYSCGFWRFSKSAESPDSSERKIPKSGKSAESPEEKALYPLILLNSTESPENSLEKNHGIA